MSVTAPTYRRVEAINGHLAASGGSNPAAVLNPYAVPLPERLSDGDFQVYRNAGSHTRLMTGFAMPFENVKTLHDVWESTCSRHSDLPIFGARRVSPDGTPREYEWITYKQAYDRRAALSAPGEALDGEGQKNIRTDHPGDVPQPLGEVFSLRRALAHVVVVVAVAQRESRV